MCVVCGASDGVLHWQARGPRCPFSGPEFLASNAGLTATLIGAARQSTARAKFNERIRREKQEALDTAIREVKGTGDLLGLMNANRKQMDAYDSLARSQAAFSYRTSQIAMGVGLALVMSGVIIVILSE
jgi:hypothetical protein